MATWTEPAQVVPPNPEQLLPAQEMINPELRQRLPETPVPVIGDHGWPIPSSISEDPDEARAAIQLPKFDAFLLGKAQALSSHFPFAEAEYRNLRGHSPDAIELEIPHFERVFRIAARMAGIKQVHQAPDYDALLIVTAFY